VALLNPAEWSKAVKGGVAAIVTIATIIGMYVSVEGWAEEKITESERRMIEERAEAQALNDINHDKIIQSSRLNTAQTNISIVEIEITILEDEIEEREEDGRDPTERQERAMDRLLRILETYEGVEVDATDKLTHISTSQEP
jgi:hypothetical protein